MGSAAFLRARGRKALPTSPSASASVTLALGALRKCVRRRDTTPRVATIAVNTAPIQPAAEIRQIPYSRPSSIRRRLKKSFRPPQSNTKKSSPWSKYPKGPQGSQPAGIKVSPRPISVRRCPSSRTTAAATSAGPTPTPTPTPIHVTSASATESPASLSLKPHAKKGNGLNARLLLRRG
ncbi:hypothetical protein EDB80DRAFT_387927 [Ilyonectria destructans]|nr:hypothetical protein EDB80DRAFT_387927 [Ilyonectria destructans]